MSFKTFEKASFRGLKIGSLILALAMMLSWACALLTPAGETPPEIEQPSVAPPEPLESEETIPPIETPLETPSAPTTLPATPAFQGLPLNSSPPATSVRLVFIHHSTGEDWLKPEGGNLRERLNQNGYFVTDTTYDWGPPDQDVGDGKLIGHHTDIGHWYNWFLGPHREEYLQALYSNSHVSEAIGENTLANPGGENRVVLFKSCFSGVGQLLGNPDDPPLPQGEDNPLWGVGVCDDEQCSGDQYYTVSNIKGLYRDLLAYFVTQPDKLFILITTPPSHDQAMAPEQAANLRAINTWLVHHWLDDYPLNNVAVFDYFNVLTSNGGNANMNDMDAESGSHHRLKDGQVEHMVGASDFLAYPSEGPDNHPTSAGHQKATEEFIPLLNIVYHCWQGDGGCPPLMGRETSH
jgi:hypothetical protein